MRQDLWRLVIRRDAEYIWANSGSVMTFDRWFRDQHVICMIKFLDPKARGECRRPQTVDHVKDQPRMGKRAPDDLLHLVAACTTHNVDIPPSKEQRALERTYLGLK